jgi:hypothetical protein
MSLGDFWDVAAYVMSQGNSLIIQSKEISFNKEKSTKTLKFGV